MMIFTKKLFSFLILLTAVTAAFAQAPANNECTGAVDLNSLFGDDEGVTNTSSSYTNVDATTEASDPATGWDCFGEPDGSGTSPSLEQTVWFSFTGDGNSYFIETSDCGGTAADYIDDGDTQIAIYTGDCSGLTPEACNEDGPSATATLYPAGLTLATTDGTVYYMMIDGFSFSGAVSDGDFCIEVTRLGEVACNPGNVDTSIDPVSICPGETATASTDGTEEYDDLVGGYAWVFNELAGDNDIFLSLDPTGPTDYTFDSDLNGLLSANSFPMFEGEFSVIGAAYTDAGNPQTTTCGLTADSIMVTFLLASDPACTGTAIQDIADSGNFGIVNMMPVPAVNDLNVIFSSKQVSDLILEVYDITGRLVYSEAIMANIGDNTHQLKLNNMTSGMYVLTMTDGSEKVSATFVKD